MIAAGDNFPSADVKYITAEGVSDSDGLSAVNSGTSVLFSVPGAFTPTCHANHLPGYVGLVDDFKSKGVDRIICLTVNDQHVVKAWAEASNALGKVDFIADGNADLSKALGIDKDMSMGGMGTRSVRAAMIIKDGKVTDIFTEENPGQVTSSGAPFILDQIGQN